MRRESLPEFSGCRQDGFQKKPSGATPALDTRYVTLRNFPGNFTASLLDIPVAFDTLDAYSDWLLPGVERGTLLMDQHPPPQPADYCCNPGCTSDGEQKIAKARGICNNCYQVLRRMIASSESSLSSWEEAEDLGWCRPPRQPGDTRFDVSAISAKNTESPDKSARDACSGN